jgi:hypothetical protein
MESNSRDHLKIATGKPSHPRSDLSQGQSNDSSSQEQAPEDHSAAAGHPQDKDDFHSSSSEDITDLRRGEDRSTARIRGDLPASEKATFYFENGSACFDRILLKTIDEKSSDWISRVGIPLDQKLRAFLVLVVRISNKTKLDLKEQPDDEFIEQISSQIRSTPNKRKDQKLRMVFNGIFKILINQNPSAPDCRCGHSKLDTFLDKYAPANRDKLRSLIEDCRVPSKRRLKSFFIRYPDLKRDVMEVLRLNVYLDSYLRKREKRAKKISEFFKRIFSEKVDDVDYHYYSLKEYVKSFPWSVSELSQSCTLLQAIISESNSKLKPRISQEEVNHKIHFLVESFTFLIKRGPVIAPGATRPRAEKQFPEIEVSVSGASCSSERDEGSEYRA